MAYSTQTDLEEQISQAELIELTDDAGSGQKLKRKSLDEIADDLAEIAARWDEPDTGIQWGWKK